MFRFSHQLTSVTPMTLVPNTATIAAADALIARSQDWIQKSGSE
jgi:hypothetical protein